MITIEKALGMYTDMLNENKKIDLNFFKKQLSGPSYKEFLELIEVVNLCKLVRTPINLVRTPINFESEFKRIDKIKEKYYSKLPL